MVINEAASKYRNVPVLFEQLPHNISCPSFFKVPFGKSWRKVIFIFDPTHSTTKDRWSPMFTCTSLRIFFFFFFLPTEMWFIATPHCFHERTIETSGPTCATSSFSVYLYMQHTVFVHRVSSEECNAVERLCQVNKALRYDLIILLLR